MRIRSTSFTFKKYGKRKKFFHSKENIKWDYIVDGNFLRKRLEEIKREIEKNACNTE